MALRHEIYRHEICPEGLSINIIHWIFAFVEPAGRINELIAKILVQVLIEPQFSTLGVVLYFMLAKVLLCLKDVRVRTWTLLVCHLRLLPRAMRKCASFACAGLS